MPDAGGREAAPGVCLRFVAGTLAIEGLPRGRELPEGGRWDARSACHRVPASAYAEVVRTLVGAGVPYRDEARAYTELAGEVRVRREPRPYQQQALEAWEAARGRGVVVLPTGAGKSLVALLAIARKRRDALVVAPTLDLVAQWYDLLRVTFATTPGVIGGGEYRVEPLTVTTYESAHRHMETLGNRFGVVVFDECHHLPGSAWGLAARLSLAPWRLGLSATPERPDERHHELEELVGPVVYRQEIHELEGAYLAPYDTERVIIELGPEERQAYDAARAVYLGFLRRQGIRMSGPGGWQKFIQRASRGADGRRAFQAYRRQRELAHAAPGKLDYLEHLLGVHRRDRSLIFTEDNATAYAVSRRFLVPAITHQTRVSERSDILERFARGDYHAVATSRVLNEGVDVPEANVAVVLSGSGSVREHVQRLGRILRPRQGKRAVLYEIVSAGTAETQTSERRRHHSAWRRPAETDADG
jgi:superfamily II DNA or RNA helicase